MKGGNSAHLFSKLNRDVSKLSVSSLQFGSSLESWYGNVELQQAWEANGTNIYLDYSLFRLGSYDQSYWLESS